jgi:glycogen debranching enzyme
VAAVDFLRNLVLKENYSFLVADEDGGVDGGEKGLYDRDTRFLSRYVWELGDGFQTLLVHAPRPDRLELRQARIHGHAQEVGVRRDVSIGGCRLGDELVVANTGRTPQRLTLRLRLAADFSDLFEARGWYRPARAAPAAIVGDAVVSYRFTASDGVQQATEVRFSTAPDSLDARGAAFELALEPQESWRVRVDTVMTNPLGEELAGPTYAAWRACFAELVSAFPSAALKQAVDDLRSLLLFTRAGPVPAAGVPWFVAAFGRDALLTSHLLLPFRPDVAEGTLRYLAGLQATGEDAFRGAQAGKIPHEMRFGELARTKVVPHAPYYGTVDATPLFVTLLGAVADVTGSDALVEELRPAWEAALGWMRGAGDPDGDGFVEFVAGSNDGKARLGVQSWKDSSDSMAHADGSLARGLVAVSEVQGYTYAAYRTAARFYRRLGDEGAERRWQASAEDLQRRFQEAFWLDDLGTYAMALDGDKRPLRVASSDAGQLLWTGIVPPHVAPRLVRSLFAEDCYSGWGFRTLGTGERRFNPVSYHNGSVWPHDTALIAAGLERYGFRDEARRVARDVLALAEAQPDGRLPELVAGYARDEGPPVPYPSACRPQAWDAAAVVLLAGLLARAG